MLLDDRIEAALNLDGHRHRRFYPRTALAIRAWLIHRVPQRFIEPLAGHFHQPDGRNLQHLGLGLVLLEPVLDRLVNRLLVFAMAHVDQVDDDKSTDVAQPELAGDLDGGLDVGFENHFIDVLRATVAAGVDVDGDQRLGFIDHDVAAAFQPDLAGKCLVDLLLDVDPLEDRLSGRRHVVDAALGPAGNFASDLADHFRGVGVVAHHLVDLIS